MKMKERKKTAHGLYVELVKLQKEIISSKLKLLVILEGRDTAGKDGTIKSIIKHLSPRETKVVALGKPSDREEKEWYFQRYVLHLPIAGELTLFNRSWYNRLGVEKVEHFCSDREYKAFFGQVELFEKILHDAGFIILKYYLDISKKEQAQRIGSRETDPLKKWKLSPIDKDAQKEWEEYSDARDKMLEKTNFEYAPWFVVNAEDKKTAHIAIIAHLLKHLKYHDKAENKLEHIDGLVYPATPETIKEKLY